MDKQKLRQKIDKTRDREIIEVEIDLYQSEIRQEADQFLKKVAMESKKQKKSRIKLIALLVG